jgi:hypothetical protein
MRSPVFQNLSQSTLAFCFVVVAFGTSCEESQEQWYEQWYEPVHTCQVETVTRAGIVIHINTLGYGENGKLILEENDYDADGQPDRVTRYVNGSDGNLLRVDYDDDGNGQIDRRMPYTYDSRGNVLEYKMDTCDDPSPGLGWLCQWKVFTYNEHNSPLTVFDYSEYSGAINECERRTYDEYNRMTIRDVDPACSCIGNPEINCNDVFDEWDRREILYYDDVDRLVVKNLDYGMDGLIDAQVTNQYDSNGDLISIQRDWDFDGSIDGRTDYTYDAAHNMLSENNDPDGDGVVDWGYAWIYDAQNNMLTYTEFESDGEERRCHAWTYDENNNVLTKVVDDYCDDIDVELSSFTYECP